MLRFDIFDLSGVFKLLGDLLLHMTTTRGQASLVTEHKFPLNESKVVPKYKIKRRIQTSDLINRSLTLIEAAFNHALKSFFYEYCRNVKLII